MSIPPLVRHRQRHLEVVRYLIRDKHSSVTLGQSDARALLEWANW